MKATGFIFTENIVFFMQLPREAQTVFGKS